MSLEVMDHDKGSVNDEIGKVKIDLKDVAPKVSPHTPQRGINFKLL